MRGKVWGNRDRDGRELGGEREQEVTKGKRQIVFSFFQLLSLTVLPAAAFFTFLELVVPSAR